MRTESVNLDKTKIKPLEFEAFGVKIGVFCNDSELERKIKKVLPVVVPNRLKFKTNDINEHNFYLEKDKNDDSVLISRNDEEGYRLFDEARILDYFSSQIRITVAEFAKSNVFIHAGAVGWKGVGIIIPGRSYSGKTTLVSELIKLGAEYYSDEYAVLDSRGYLQPYPKMLSMRGIVNDWDQVDTAPEKFGAIIGRKPLRVGAVLVTKFEKSAKWKPEILSPGEGVMEILQHTIPIRNKPEFVLKVLKKTISRAIIAKSKRGAAHIFAPFYLEYIETALK